MNCPNCGAELVTTDGNAHEEPGKPDWLHCNVCGYQEALASPKDAAAEAKLERIRKELRDHGARAFLEARSHHRDALDRMLADAKACPCGSGKPAFCRWTCQHVFGDGNA